ncbi:2-oxo-4-hydroxy-4-carboxy-5-ureidoimidazoline decarboxylase [Streptomyces polyrhachis]|uniref:2-oxo-4-hydroxy-4-carboxy-5-ureidoimidazoline decarboxylase n=1 Tax=Streptomyces polyrhachis TaxID=1282885 RepID=A0ABW2GCC5_9ACTN
MAVRSPFPTGHRHTSRHPPDPTSPRRSGALTGLAALNTAPPADAEAALTACHGSHRWARRLAAHRPYPDLPALLAAADEAAYDLTPADLGEALAHEPAARPPALPSLAAHTALRAAHAAYESRFGHVFVLCLDAYEPAEHLDQLLAGIRTRLSHTPEQEHAVTAEELRKLARGRLARLARGRPMGIRVRQG